MIFQGTMLILKPIVKHSTFVHLMDKVDYRSTLSFALMGLFSTRTISFATGGSTSIVLRLKNSILSTTTLPQKEKLTVPMVQHQPHKLHMQLTKVQVHHMLDLRVRQTMKEKFELGDLAGGKADGFAAEHK